MRFINTPFLIITISTILGICIGNYCSLSYKIVFLGFFCCICILFMLKRYAYRNFNKGYVFAIFVVPSFVIFGLILTHIHDARNYKNHYTNQLSRKDVKNNPIGIQFSIKERLKSTSYYHKYVVSLLFANNQPVEGKILLQIHKDNLHKVLDIGDVYTAYTTLKPITQPLNPYQFDYADYLSKRNVYYSITTSSDKLIKNDYRVNSLSRIADKIRIYCNSKLERYSFEKEQLSVINALILGQKQDIPTEILENYRNAGAVHILAVSGLHVGIILMILNAMLSPLERILKKGGVIKLIIVIVSLWAFAILAGLSPSVIRAVTMFSFIAISLQIKSLSSIYNALIISAFIMLCFDPWLLFSVSFQLSYVAVLSIVWIQPILTKMYNPKFYILKKIWDTLTVTIAAQFGLLPLTLFYFHQFPSLFVVSNLIVIPFLGGILGFGILVIVLAICDILPDFLVKIFSVSIDSINTLMDWIAHQKMFLIQNISFSFGMFFISYLSIISLIVALKKNSRRNVYQFCTCLLLLFMFVLFEKHQALIKKEFVIFNQPKNTIFGVLHQRRFKIYSKDTITAKNKNFLFDGYLIHHYATVDTVLRLKNVYQYKNKSILIVDQSGIYKIQGLKPEIVVLTGNPKIHLERLIYDLCPKQIIADANNHKSDLERWEKSCYKLNVPFYRTDKKGAFFLN
ncbi:ComEC/Rec2 family competence protein [Aquimarina algicola]|nr:ComEC/Rec2 family competence protein [Aquimarina algicola]